MTVPDEVMLGSSGSGERMTLEAFLQLPLSQRITHLLDRSAVFLAGGRPLDRDVALAAIRQAQAARTSASPATRAAPGA